MGKSAQTIGFEYYMGVHYGLCHGPIDELVSMKGGDRIAWTGSQTTSGPVIINAPNLFGGQKKEGGLVGTLDVMMGGSTQQPNSYLGAKQGGLNPAYRGLCTAVFHGYPQTYVQGGALASLIAAITDSEGAGFSTGGALVASMNPYVKPIGFRVRRALAGWNTAVWNSGQAIINLESSTIKAMNPAHIAYQVITDPEWGMGYPTSSIDTTSFLATAQTLYDEGFGLCLKWNRIDTIESFLQLIADHVGGGITSDRRTGKFRFDLVRSGYSLVGIPEFNETNIVEMVEFEPPSFEDSVNEITVTYRDPLTNKDAVVTVQALANVQIIGRVVNEKRDYPGLPTHDLASRVALRDVKASSVGLKRLTLTVDRAGYDIRPLSVIRVTIPLENIDMYMRVGAVEYGTLKQGVVKITAIEDLFGLAASTYLVGGQSSQWVDPATSASNVLNGMVMEATYLDLYKSYPSAELTAIPSTAGHVNTFATKPSTGALNYDIYEEAVFAGLGDFCAYANIGAVGLTILGTSATLEGVLDPNQIVAGTMAWIGTEIVQVTSYNVLTRAIVLVRGCVDTVPTAHASSTGIWFQSTPEIGTTQFLQSEVADVRMLTNTQSDKLAYASATNRTVTIAGRQGKPYPPGNVKITATAYPSAATSPFTVTWAHRDRITQGDVVYGVTTGSVGPETGATYTMQFYRTDTNGLLLSNTVLNGASAVVNLSYSGNVRMDLWTVVNGIASLQKVGVPFTHTPAVVPVNTIVGAEYVPPVPPPTSVFEACRLVAEFPITLSGVQTIDSIVGVAGNRILVAAQADATTNGLYTMAAGAWTRCTDADTTPDFYPGKQVFVSEGFADNVNSVWAISNTGSIVLGTNPINFARVGATATIFQACRLVSTIPLASLINLLVIDGVSTVAGDRILVTAQTTGSQNGIWVVAAGAWVRALDADNSSEFKTGKQVFVSSGSTNNIGTTWSITTTGTIVLGTTTVVFAKIGFDQIAGTITASRVSDFSEAVDDRVSGLLVNSAGLDKTYDDAGNLLTLGIGINLRRAAIGCTIDGGGDDIVALAEGDVTVPFACIIVGVTVLGDTVGSIEIDVWNDTYGSYPPTLADSIVGAFPPKLVAQEKSENTTLTGWNLNIGAGSTLRFHVNSCTGIKRAVLTLKVEKS